MTNVFFSDVITSAIKSDEVSPPDKFANIEVTNSCVIIDYNSLSEIVNITILKMKNV